MDFSDYLSSKAKTKIIQELCSSPNAWWSMGEIIKLTSLSSSSTQKALKTLRGEKILLSRREANRHEFRINLQSKRGMALFELFINYAEKSKKKTYLDESKFAYICEFNDGIRNLYKTKRLI